MEFDAEKYEAAKQRRVAAMRTDPRHDPLIAVLRRHAPAGRWLAQGWEPATDAALHQGASDILRAAAPAVFDAAGGKPWGCIRGQPDPMAWKPKSGHPRARLLEFACAEPFKAGVLSVPPEWETAIMHEIAMLFASVSPTVSQKQAAALALHKRTTRNHANPHSINLAFVMLRIFMDLTAAPPVAPDGHAAVKTRLTVYRHAGRAAGKALPFVREVLAALEIPGMDGATRWPAAFLKANRILKAIR